jgi:hypothetical protein
MGTPLLYIQRHLIPLTAACGWLATQDEDLVGVELKAVWRPRERADHPAPALQVHTVSEPQRTASFPHLHTRSLTFFTLISSISNSTYSSAGT